LSPILTAPPPNTDFSVPAAHVQPLFEIGFGVGADDLISALCIARKSQINSAFCTAFHGTSIFIFSGLPIPGSFFFLDSRSVPALPPLPSLSLRSFPLPPPLSRFPPQLPPLPFPPFHFFFFPLPSPSLSPPTVTPFSHRPAAFPSLLPLPSSHL